MSWGAQAARRVACGFAFAALGCATSSSPPQPTVILACGVSPSDAPVDTVIQGGDTVSTRCAWNNPSATPVHFGENTEDEMCFSFEIYYPKITIANWNWSVPSQLSKCAPTP